MKHIKLYEWIDKGNIDFDKIYVFKDVEGYQYGLTSASGKLEDPCVAIIIGKLELKNNDTFINGFLINDEKKGEYVRAWIWSIYNVEEARPKQIQEYEVFLNMKKYNL